MHTLERVDSSVATCAGVHLPRRCFSVHMAGKLAPRGRRVGDHAAADRQADIFRVQAGVGRRFARRRRRQRVQGVRPRAPPPQRLLRCCLCHWVLHSQCAIPRTLTIDTQALRRCVLSSELCMLQEGPVDGGGHLSLATLQKWSYLANIRLAHSVPEHMHPPRLPCRDANHTCGPISLSSMHHSQRDIEL